MPPLKAATVVPYGELAMVTPGTDSCIPATEPWVSTDHTVRSSSCLEPDFVAGGGQVLRVEAAGIGIGYAGHFISARRCAVGHPQSVIAVEIIAVEHDKLAAEWGNVAGVDRVADNAVDADELVRAFRRAV